jgi:hypothetical protein
MSELSKRIIDPCKNCPIAMELGVIENSGHSPYGLAINDLDRAQDVKKGAILDGSKCNRPKRTLDFGIKACKAVVKYN